MFGRSKDAEEAARLRRLVADHEAYMKQQETLITQLRQRVKDTELALSDVQKRDLRVIHDLAGTENKLRVCAETTRRLSEDKSRINRFILSHCFVREGSRFVRCSRSIEHDELAGVVREAFRVEV